MTRTVLRTGFIVVLSVLLSGCPTGPRVVEPSPSGLEPRPLAELRGADLYRLSAEASRLKILVFRGGPLARLGHNHVVSSRSLAGYVWAHATPALSGFEVVVPVGDLVVDDPATRQDEGEDFPVEIPEDAREGTRRNMLREEVLDATHYPVVRLRSTGITGSREAPTVAAQITIKDVSREVGFPVRVVYGERKLTASGEFSIRQSEFGITPFSVGLGALQVEDEMRIKFELVAVRSQ